ncbi:hypothetical protein NUU61_007406 [Penicillium alfredii]|uniref:NACHT domain-containing protein n=1 Tax=Penicillium alfredii TaxID=1506179 RepID=A0A9W9K4Q3_9EURO|nr:uncharacterized protein NUU61_007406 [Penicillium alfredii]KAJ5092536.1 hypothetical protein NUU61_007406 [Penicillium alfredii]
MADPASIVSLILETGRVITCLINYAHAVQNAKADSRRLSEELFALKGILEHLAAHERAPQPDDSKDSTAAIDPAILSRTLYTTSQLLGSLLKDLEEPATKSQRLKQRLTWPFTQDQFNKHLARLERVKSWLILVLMTDNASATQDLHQEINTLTGFLREDLKIRAEERNLAENRSLFAWLAPVSPANAHLRASRAREIGSGRWFLHGHVTPWLLTGPQSKNILFLVGKSGAGKTTLFAQVVDELTVQSSADPDSSFSLAYFYCAFGDTASQDLVNILGSLVAQLSSSMPSILDSIRPIYNDTPKSQTHRHPIDINILEDAIIRHSSGSRQVVLLIDAINESLHAERIKRSLLRLASLSTNLRIVITSTTDVISSIHATAVNMNAEVIRNDIEAFIHHRFKQDETLGHLSAALKEEISTTLLSEADGSFRWAQLSLDNLSAQRTAKSMREALRNLPGTLRETYASILERIAPSDWLFAREALFWLSFAKRPLTLRELNEAVVLGETTTVLDDDMTLVSPHVILQICQGFITRDRTGKVNLAHSSVKDFLTSEWIRSSRVQYFSLDPSTADSTIMRKCLSYLCLENLRSGYRPSPILAMQRLQEYPFLEYAAQYWALHGASCKFEDRDRQMVNRFFETKHLPQRGNFGAWVQTLIPEADIAHIETTHPLYYAASFGLVSVVRAILDSDPDIDVDAPGGRFGSTPLFVACWRSNYEVARLLLSVGANPNILDASSGLTSFSLARLKRHRPLAGILETALVK